MSNYDLWFGALIDLGNPKRTSRDLRGNLVLMGPVQFTTCAIENVV